MREILKPGIGLASGAAMIECVKSGSGLPTGPLI